ncbi:flagellar motor switch protein FliG [Peptococcaceae bacterium]|nr:flagellar motor switch protein FliG [Peptococcaceae bacterium]MCL0072040.1 flagellar motor switch protein FliG [Peptococcaceae bacterium]MCL0100602.1 flagellar motor switch protein FliG [Peptococcaceae bacterium]
MPDNLSGEHKVAIILMSLGTDLSANVLKYGFTDIEIERVTSIIADLDTISDKQIDEVVKEFLEMYKARGYVLEGGIDYARKLLEKAVGAAKAREIMERISQSLRATPFQKLRKADPKQIISFIKDENPQTIAFVLAHLKPDQAATILAELDPDLQADIAKRIATLDRASPEVVQEIERVLESKLSAVMTSEETIAGGVESLVNILNRVDRSTEKTIFEKLEQTDPTLAEEVRMRMFIFEDIVKLHDVSIQKVLREVDTRDLALAMKGANEEVNERIFKNMSKRAAAMLKEEIEYMGPVRLRDVEEAQQKIVNVIRKLEESGEIVISRGGEDALIV